MKGLREEEESSLNGKVEKGRCKGGEWVVKVKKSANLKR